MKHKTAECDYNNPCNSQCDAVVAFIRSTDVREAFAGGQAVRVLELGCGTGPFGRRLLAEYPAITVTGIDVLPDSIETLRGLLAAQSLATRYRALVGDALDAGLFAPDSFDVILAPSVLHHIERLADSPVPGNLRRWLPVRGIGMPLIVLRNVLNNLVARVTWGDWHWPACSFS